jgi:hypothetical protein
MVSLNWPLYLQGGTVLPWVTYFSVVSFGFHLHLSISRCWAAEPSARLLGPLANRLPSHVSDILAWCDSGDDAHERALHYLPTTSGAFLDLAHSQGRQGTKEGIMPLRHSRHKPHWSTPTVQCSIVLCLAHKKSSMRPGLIRLVLDHGVFMKTELCAISWIPLQFGDK